MKIARYQWVLVALLWFVALLNYLDRQVIFAVFPLLQAELHVTSLQLGLLGTAFLWVYGILSPFGGWMADRFGRRRVILFSLAIWSAVTWLTGHSRTYGELAAARGLMGISEACYLPAALALISDYHGENTRARAVGLHQSGLYVGVAVGGIGGGWVGEHFGWRTAFFLLGAIGIVYALALWPALREAPRRSGETPEPDGAPFLASLRELLKSEPFRHLIFVNSLASLAYWCVYTWLALHLFERFHMSLAGAGFWSTFYIQAASFGGILFGGWLADRWSRNHPRGRVWAQTIGLGAAGPFLFLVGLADTRWVLVPCLVLFGLGRGFFDCNLMPVVCQIVSPGLRATAYGVLNLTSCIAGGAMAAAGGALKDSIGLGGAIELSGVMLIVAAASMFAIRLPAPAQRSSSA